MKENNIEEEAINKCEIDAQILVDKLFKPVLNMHYPEGEKNMVYSKYFIWPTILHSLFFCSVDGRKGIEAVQACVDNGEAIVGFTVARVSTRMIMKIADADKILPPKVSLQYGSY